MEFKHIPVLFRESIDALDIKSNGLYADCTAGGGGHGHISVCAILLRPMQE